ncbi:MAG: SPOR domain-containing protein [Sphingobacteriaceae bacterium]|nr:MAG: SPOR domain-containing protein [Sphingobacteriaceae bacterium]
MKNTSVYKAIFSCIAGCVFFMPIFTFAQERGKVEVIKDSRIDTLIAKRFNLKSPAAAKVVPYSSRGYRVQIYSGPNRTAAYEAQAKFQSKYPGQRTYITYTEPYFKVKAGDYRTRLEAERIMQQLKGNFTGLFIISEKINPSKADTSND